MDLVRHYTGRDGRSIELVVGQPEPDGNDWCCAVRVDGKASKAMGVDPIQAILLALTIAATRLYCSDEYPRGELTWMGGADLGLPIADSIRVDVEAARVEVARVLDARRSVNR